MIYIASHALTEYALLEGKHICWHNNIGEISTSFLEKHLFLHIMSIICLQN
jgi:hypothetical protein